MKKIVFLLFFILCLTGCSAPEKPPEADEYSWKMTAVQNGDDGAVILCSPEEKIAYPKAEEKSITCSAKNGVLTLKDNTERKRYSGSFRKIEANPESIIYEVKIGNTEGHATSGRVTYADQSWDPVFILSIGDYVLNFEG